MDDYRLNDMLSVAQVFDEALERDGPSHPFLDMNGERYTLGDLDRLSTTLARGLLARGAGPGETVVSILDNSIEQVLLLLANARIGAIHVPVNTAYRGEFLRHQVADTGAKIVIAAAEYVPRLLEIEPGIPEAQRLLIQGEYSGPPPSRLTAESFSAAQTGAGDIKLPARPKPGDIAMLIYTAGTTGPSKGCMMSHNYVTHIARQLNDSFLVTKNDITWTPLPGFHANQVVNMVAMLLVGGRLAVFPRFSVSRFWPEIERTGATIINLIGAMSTMIAGAPDNDAMKRCFRQIRVAGCAPFPVAAQQIWRERFGAREMGQVGFGMTECTRITSCRIDDQRPANASGRRNDCFDIRLVDDYDNDVAPGEAGEIIVRPRKPHIMFEGYWRRPADTLKQFRNLWFHTGDIGRFDTEGWFYFVDRKKDYLRRRGENISTVEMETTLIAHAAIKEVAVHAVPADMAEDEVKVTAVLHEGATLTESDYCRWIVERVPYFAVPRYIEFRTELPRNQVGRILKFQLKDAGVTATTWDREKAGFQIERR